MPIPSDPGLRSTLASGARSGHYALVAAVREIDEIAKRHWLDWLAEITDGDGVAGFDAAGWSATTWVLHSIHEDRAHASEATYDDVRRSRLAAVLDNPLIIGSINHLAQTWHK